jgi:hypothetical protein
LTLTSFSGILGATDPRSQTAQGRSTAAVGNFNKTSRLGEYLRRWHGWALSGGLDGALAGSNMLGAAVPNHFWRRASANPISPDPQFHKNEEDNRNAETIVMGLRP